MFLNSVSIGNVWEFLKWHISQLLARIEALIVTLPLEFGRLHNDIFFCEGILPEVIKEIATANSTCPYYEDVQTRKKIIEFMYNSVDP